MKRGIWSADWLMALVIALIIGTAGYLQVGALDGLE